ncbi:MAG: PLP-dependent transferase [bacterium]
MKGFSAKAIHGAELEKDVHGALRFPVYDSVSFEYASSEEIQLAFEGKKPAHSYSRISKAEAGSNIITTKYLFGNTYSLFEKTLKPWGLNIKYVDMDNIEEIENAIDGKTRAIFAEVITNPQLQVPDIKKIAEIASSKGVPLVVDTTLTTTRIFKSRDKEKIEMGVGESMLRLAVGIEDEEDIIDDLNRGLEAVQ